MKAILLILTLCMIPMSGFAKGKRAKLPVRMKFTPYVYYKLDHKGRIKYLNAFIEVAREADKKLRAEGKPEKFMDIFDFMIPHADAAGNVCLLGGIYFDKPAGVNNCNDVTKVPSDFQFNDLNSFYKNSTATPNCKPENRCAAYFGVNSSGDGLCFKSAGNATSECYAESKKQDGVKNLASILNNCSANQAKCSAFQKAMAKEQEKLSAYCDAHSKSGACKKAKETIASLTGDAAKVPAGVLVDNKTGCTDGNLGQMNADNPDSLAKQLNMKNGVDPYWYQLARLGSLACDSSKKMSTEEIFKNVGVCEARSGAEAACQAPQSELGKCINGEIEKMGQDAFRKAVADADSSLCKTSWGGATTCTKGNNPLEIRNAIESGKIEGFEKVVAKMCPSQGKSFTDCRARSGGAGLEAKPDVTRLLRNTVEAESAVRNLESFQNLTDGQKAGFEKFFGISPEEFKSVFCAKSPEAARMNAEKAFFAKGAGDNPVRARMQACAQETVKETKRFMSGATKTDTRSNYQDRACNQVKITNIREGDLNTGMKNYLYYEKDTGRCYKGSDIMTSLPSGAKSSCSSKCNNDNVGIISTPRYIKLEHSYAGSDAEPCYACMDKDFFSSAKFDIFQIRCQTDEMGGMDFPKTAQ